uniref:Uncharacterized protein n=1 Tax=Pseudo-nitzschia australis TaxID=44445 RepID=A0A7S4ADA0_9STRA
MVDQGDNQQKHQENANNYSSDMDSIYPSLFPTTNDLDKTKTKNSNSNNNNRDNDCDSFYPTPPFQVSNTPMIMATQPNQSHYPMLPDMECTSGSSPPASASKLSSRPFSYSSRALSGVSATSTRTGVSSLSVLSQCPHDNNSNTADNSNNINTNDAVTCSFYESLRQEAASCCPLCGFQILANPNASTSANTHATTAHHLPVGTCFVCLQAVVEGAVKGNNVSYNNSLNNSTKVNNTNWMTKERQVQEDRQLAASLSVMILEEEPKQEENNQDHHHHRGRQAVALLEDYGDDLIVASGNDNGNDIDNGNDYSRSNFTPNGNIDSQSPHCYSYPSEETIAEFTTSPLCSSRHHNHVQHRNETHMTPREWLVKEQMAMLAAAAADAAYSRNDTTAKKNENALYAENTEVANTTDSNSNSIKNCHTNSSGNSNNTLITPSHDRKCTDSCGVVYIGNYNILDQPHGSHGELIWDNGDRYVGTVQNGMRSGQGTFFFRDGTCLFTTCCIIPKQKQGCLCSMLHIAL